MHSLEITFSNAARDRVARLLDARRVEVEASFGAMGARCWITLHNNQTVPALDYGFSVVARISGHVVFVGRLAQLRAATVQPTLALYAERMPEQDIPQPVSGTYDGLSCRAILEMIVEQLPSGQLSLVEPVHAPVVVDRLALLRLPFFYAVDLLAKLAGNALWDVTWDNRLRWRPPSAPSDHVLYFDKRLHTFRLWETDETVRNSFEFHGGPDALGNEFRRQFEAPGSIARFGRRHDTLFVRAISTQAGFALLRDAVLAQLPHETHRRYLDLVRGWPEVTLGDTFTLRNAPVNPLDASGSFRVKTVQHVWAAGRLWTRVHLASGYESSSRFTRYIDHDVWEARQLLGRFQLDLSALDTAAYLG